MFSAATQQSGAAWLFFGDIGGSGGHSTVKERMIDFTQYQIDFAVLTGNHHNALPPSGAGSI